MRSEDKGRSGETFMLTAPFIVIGQAEDCNLSQENKRTRAKVRARLIVIVADGDTPQLFSAGAVPVSFGV